METLLYKFGEIDYVIFIGKNKYNNWKIIDSSKKTDIWFHTENDSSSHVVLQTDKTINEIPKQVIKRCACLCKTHSKSKSVQKCPIIYTTIDNIVKTDTIGQVVSQNTKRIII